MAETMTPYERMRAVWECEVPDRVPYMPMVVFFVARQGGLTIKEFVSQPEKFVDAALDGLDYIGDAQHPGIASANHMSMLGHAGWDMATLDWRLWDEFPPDGNLPSIYEKVLIQDYDDVMERGFATILFSTELKNGIHERSVEDFLYYHFEHKQVWSKAWRRFYAKTGIPILIGGRSEHPLDMLQSYRGINQLVMDMYTIPDKLIEVMEWLADYEVMQAAQEAETMGAGELPGAENIFFYNGGPPGMPPDLYGKLYIPIAKKMIDAWVERGFNVWAHWDNDLTAHLAGIRTLADGLPKGRLLMDLEKTDMKKAKEVLGGVIPICGNVPSSLMVYGTPDEVDAYCRELIEDCAPGGGFILGAECETPWDSKRENVVAMKRCAAKYGTY